MTSDVRRPLARLPLPPGEPFTRGEALRVGMTDRKLRELVEGGHLRRPVRGVYVDRLVPDDLDLRLRIVKKVVPAGSFVADRTAGWLHGANMILAPNAHLEVPKPSFFHLPDAHRTKCGLAVAGQRAVAPGDLVDLDGLLVTTPLRTALDLGRTLHRAQALSAMDSLLRLGVFSHGRLMSQVERFAKQRGVRQLRALAPLANGLAESPGESGLRLMWHDAGLPPPQLQIPYVESGRTLYYLDLGLEELRFAAEYDGVEWHSSPTDVEHDRVRRARMRDVAGWEIEEFRAEHVYGRAKDADWALADAIIVARSTFDRRTRYL